MKTFVLSLFAVLFVLSSNTYAQQGGKLVFKELSPKTFQQTYRKTSQAVMLDVRTPEEFEEGHLSKAVNIDYKNDNFRNQVSKLDKSKPYFVYCKGGVRSAKAADIMKELGFKQVYSLEGGIDAWEDEELPVEKK